MVPCPVLHFAFHNAKLLLASVPVLTHPEPRAAISLALDASDSYLGVVFQQSLIGAWSPLSFFSKRLSSAKSKYSTFNRELLAAYSSVCHFHFLLPARAFAAVSAISVNSAFALDLSALGFDFSALPGIQSTFPSIQSMISNPSLSVISFPFLRSPVLCDVSSGSLCPLVLLYIISYSLLYMASPIWVHRLL